MRSLPCEEDGELTVDIEHRARGVARHMVNFKVVHLPKIFQTRNKSFERRTAMNALFFDK